MTTRQRVCIQVSDCPAGLASSLTCSTLELFFFSHLIEGTLQLHSHVELSQLCPNEPVQTCALLCRNKCKNSANK